MKPKIIDRRCRFSESQIEKSGLLTEERFREVQEAVTARISPAFDRDGKKLGDAMIVHFDDGRRWIHPKVDNDYTTEDVRTNALADALTAKELETVNQFCLEACGARNEAKKFNEAEKVTEWDGGAWVGDTYCHTMEEALERLEWSFEDENDWPEYLWAALPRRVIGKFDSWDICENMICDDGWEDMGPSDLEGLEELQVALDKFTEANAGVLSYNEDYSRAVLLAGFKEGDESPLDSPAAAATELTCPEAGVSGAD